MLLDGKYRCRFGGAGEKCAKCVRPAVPKTLDFSGVGESVRAEVVKSC